MAKSVMIDNDVHENLLNVQAVIYKKRKFNMNLGDIVSVLLTRDAEEIAEDVLELSELIPIRKKLV